MIRILRIIFVLGFFTLCLINCQTKNEATSKPEYMRFVGDIKQDSISDDSNFILCNEGVLLQYFNTGEGFKYKGEKPELIKEIKKKFKPVSNLENQHGYIRIRFVINCNGEAGRFRILSSDFNYEPKEFDSALVSQLLKAVKGLDGWQTIPSNNKPQNYYMYLIFKIDNGQIIEILP